MKTLSLSRLCLKFWNTEVGILCRININYNSFVKLYLKCYSMLIKLKYGKFNNKALSTSHIVYNNLEQCCLHICHDKAFANARVYYKIPKHA